MERSSAPHTSGKRSTVSTASHGAGPLPARRPTGRPSGAARARRRTGSRTRAGRRPVVGHRADRPVAEVDGAARDGRIVQVELGDPGGWPRAARRVRRIEPADVGLAAAPIGAAGHADGEGVLASRANAASAAGRGSRRRRSRRCRGRRRSATPRAPRRPRRCRGSSCRRRRRPRPSSWRSARRRAAASSAGVSGSGRTERSVPPSSAEYRRSKFDEATRRRRPAAHRGGGEPGREVERAVRGERIRLLLRVAGSEPHRKQDGDLTSAPHQALRPAGRRQLGLDLAEVGDAAEERGHAADQREPVLPERGVLRHDHDVGEEAIDRAAPWSRPT